MTNFSKTYKEEIAPKLAKEFGIENVHAVPHITKIVINSGIGEALKNKEIVEKASGDIALITGQAPSVRRAKLSVASFSLREGAPIGLKVTLRGERMYNFFHKLVSIVLPRLRDFRGVSKSHFDAHGNYNLGIVDYSVFPEIDITKSGGRGLEVTIVTSTKDKEQSEKLLELMGFPFKKEEDE